MKLWLWDKITASYSYTARLDWAEMQHTDQYNPTVVILLNRMIVNEMNWVSLSKDLKKIILLSQKYNGSQYNKNHKKRKQKTHYYKRVKYCMSDNDIKKIPVC